MSSSAADRLARLATVRNTPAGTTPQPTPVGPAGETPKPVPPKGGTGRRKLPRSSRNRKVPYSTWLTEPQAVDLVRLGFRLRAELEAAGADPAAVAKASGYARLGALMSLDWSDVRRPRRSTLDRIGAAAGFPAELVDAIAAAHPHAISEEYTP